MCDELKVVLVDDNENFVKLQADVLKVAGFNTSYFVHARDFINKIVEDESYRKSIGVLLLDLQMPFSGLDVINEIRKKYNYDDIQIVVYSAELNDISKKECIDLGANDYFDKTIEIPDLVNKIRARLRNSNNKADSKKSTGIKKLEEIDIEVNEEERTIFVNQKNVHLKEIEYDIFLLLLNNYGEYITARRINNEIFGFGNRGNSDNFRCYISRIRKKLIDVDSKYKTIIKSTRNYGWMLSINQ
ncbi:MAG: response regulator transcription factor [Candidatus Ancillula sp.]|nr:response regulator transcription factor [Candidatus Ancillula sp.]